MQRRAITDSQKAARRQRLLAAAREQLQERSFEAVSMRGIARAAGLAKGTIYLYFESKEALFLALLSESFLDWFDRLDAMLCGLGDRTGVRQVAALLGSALPADPALLRLFAMLPGVLEQKIAPETLLDFKRHLLARVLRTGALLERCLPGLAAGTGARLFMRGYALVLGLNQLAHPAPLLRQLYAVEPALRLFEVDLEEELTATLTLLLVGEIGEKESIDGA